jgi:hypothetical protein
MLLLIEHGIRLGLRFWQDVSDSTRIMFDANQLGGYTVSKGIKGDFLGRLKRTIEAEVVDQGSRNR